MTHVSSDHTKCNNEMLMASGDWQLEDRRRLGLKAGQLELASSGWWLLGKRCDPGNWTDANLCSIAKRVPDCEKTTETLCSTHCTRGHARADGGCGERRSLCTE